MVTGLVMAASRRGVADAVAALQNRSHKCLVEIAGRPMLERVVGAMRDSRRFGRIYISIDAADAIRAVPQIAAWVDAGEVAAVESRDTLASSVLAAVNQIADPYPLVITTGDNALHTAALVGDFVDKFLAAAGDVAIGYTSEDVVAAEIPDSGLAYHRLKDGAYSACNLYGLRNEPAARAVRIFAGGGQFGKKHWRILKTFGAMPFILYKFKLATLEQLTNRLGRAFGVSIDAINLPYAFGPIDVDNPRSFALTERLLKARG